MKQIKQETGRSMVEMLGVLAVIGVLSVGGISGYTLAMNKQRASSVAADLMKRAMVISAQRQLGQDPSLKGFGSKVGEYELASPIHTDDTSQTFAMTVKAVPQEVCKKILALNWQNTTITPATAEGCNGDDMTFTYKYDLSSVTGSGSTGGEGSDTPQEPTCEEGSTGNGCQKCDTTTGEWVADETLNAQACGEGGVCVNGECVEKCTSWSTKECGQGMFCNFREGMPYENGYGKCTPLTNTNSKKLTVDGIEYEIMVRPEYGPDWWTSYSWCQAIGKRMISLSDLGCSMDTWSCSGSLAGTLGQAFGDEMVWTTDEPSAMLTDPAEMGYEDRGYHTHTALCRSL